MIGFLLLSVLNALFLQEHVWPVFVDFSASGGVERASHDLKTGSFIAPSRRTVYILLSSLLDSVTITFTYYVIPIDKKKTEGADIVKKSRKEREAVQLKLELKKCNGDTNIPVEDEVEAAVRTRDT